MAMQISCDGCGTDCTAAHIEHGVYAPKHYCPTCALRQEEAEDQAREAVATAARELEVRLKALGVDV